MKRHSFKHFRPYIMTVLAVIFCVSERGGFSADDLFLPDGNNVKVELWQQKLQIPWSLVFLPDGRSLVSERMGIILLIRDGTIQNNPYASIDVSTVGESGLMGLAIHPDFPRKPFIYAMHTYTSKGQLFNRVIRLVDRNNTGIFDKVIIDSIPAARFHDGGRIAFGPDGMLYVTTGDGTHPDTAQNINSLNGKILRLTPDGGIPSDNPFNKGTRRSPVYSFGQRNPQGLAWQPSTGILFESEHGPSGEFGRYANDEINIIVKGANYGWPVIIGSGKDPAYINPLIFWKDNTTPPSGMTFYNGNLLPHLKGDLFVATLRSEALLRIKLNGTGVVRVERWFAADYKNGKYGRLRDIVEGPDGALYLLTNNTDGRGDLKNSDDKIYRIVPK